MDIDKKIDIAAAASTNLGTALVGFATKNPTLIAGAAFLAPMVESMLADFFKRLLSHIQTKKLQLQRKYYVQQLIRRLKMGVIREVSR